MDTGETWRKQNTKGNYDKMEREQTKTKKFIHDVENEDRSLQRLLACMSVV
jgi:hypothetical protein